jgi:flavin-dependent dehydrogenase
MTSAVDADVAVVGAGPAGAAAALFAARGGHRVVIFDRQSFPRDKPCGEGLMPSGRPILRELGLEDEVIAAGAPPFHGIQFGLPGRPPVVVPFPEHRGERAGLGVRRLEFDARLVEQLEADDRIQFCPSTAVDDVRTDGATGPRLTTASGEVRARFVAVADGLRSPIRHRLGWTRGPRPPYRYGLIGHWSIDGPVDPWVHITFDEGLEVYDGPVAANQRMVGLLCYQERMREFGGRLAARYREVALSLRPELRRAEMVGSVSAIGPFWYRARPVANAGVFLVGDAAGFSDPITGEGMAAGLRQAQAFAAAIEQPHPERAYRLAHRRLTSDPRRVASLVLRLSRTPALVERGIRGHQRAPAALPKLLGVGFGYWGFARITPREWVAILTGR